VCGSTAGFMVFCVAGEADTSKEMHKKGEKRENSCRCAAPRHAGLFMKNGDEVDKRIENAGEYVSDRSWQV
jgi:hypothetical protein